MFLARGSTIWKRSAWKAIIKSLSKVTQTTSSTSILLIVYSYVSVTAPTNLRFQVWFSLLSSVTLRMTSSCSPRSWCICAENSLIKSVKNFWMLLQHVIHWCFITVWETGDSDHVFPAGPRPMVTCPDALSLSYSFLSQRPNFKIFYLIQSRMVCNTSKLVINRCVL